MSQTVKKVSNKSKTYLLPFFNEYVPIKYPRKLINTFLFYENEYKFCLLYEFSGKRDFIKYESELCGSEFYYKTVDITDKVLYVFDIPEDLYEIIDLFLSGKYSYLPNKDMIKEFIIDNFGVSANHRIFHILDRSEQLRDEMERKLNTRIPKNLDLSEAPDIKKEEFNQINYNGEAKEYSVSEKQDSIQRNKKV